MPTLPGRHAGPRTPPCPIACTTWARCGARRSASCCCRPATLAAPAFEVFLAERQRVSLFDDALPALAALSARYRVVALSNGNADVHRVGIGRHFHAAVSAAEVGVGKPDPRIFRAAAQAAGVVETEVLHIGDDPHLDGHGALASGMQMAWVNRAGAPWPDDVAGQPHAEVGDLAALCAWLQA